MATKDIYTVDDQPAPRNEYGRAKYEGEQQVQKYLKKYYIIRTSWVFGEYGLNFVYTMLDLAKTHKELTVVDDQYGRPSWTKNLAEFMTSQWIKSWPMGFIILSNDNSCNWYEFASAILAEKDVTVKPVSSAEYPQRHGVHGIQSWI